MSKTLYFVKLFSGDRCVGVTRARDRSHANAVVQGWCAKSERHTARIDKKPGLVAERVEPIPPENYLTQTA